MVTRVLVLTALLSGLPVFAQDEPSASGVEAARGRGIAVLPLRIDRLQGNAATRLDLLLRARVEKRSGMQVQPAGTTGSLVEAAQSLGVECELVTAECAAQFGAVADVEYVLLGIAAGYGAESGVDLRLIDVANRTELARAAALLPSDFDAEAARLGALVDVVFAPADHPQRTGQPSVDATRVQPPGATVIVDGAPRGEAPFAAPIGGLIPGTHVVTVRLDGYEPQELRFELAPSDTYALDVALVPGAGPRPKSAFERALPWTVAGAGGILLLGGAVTAAAGSLPWFNASGAQGELDALVQANAETASPTFASEAAALNAQVTLHKRDWEAWGLPALVVGGVVAGAGLVVAAGGVTWALVAGGEMTE